MQWKDLIFLDIDLSKEIAIARVVRGPMAIILTFPGFSLIKETNRKTAEIPDSDEIYGGDVLSMHCE